MEQIVHVSVPQVVGEIVEVVQIIPQERFSKRIIDRIVDVPVLMQRQSTDHPDSSQDGGASTSAVL